MGSPPATTSPSEHSQEESPRIEASASLFEAAADTRFQVREVVPHAVPEELARVGFDAAYREAAAKKFRHVVVKAADLSAPAANILKQTCLALGAEAGVHRGAINCTIDREAVLISATEAQLERIIQKLRAQPFGLKLLAESLVRMRQRQKQLQKVPVSVMAILNVTPDSFSDGGRLESMEAVLAQAQAALDAGVDILDVGGESTRPGAPTVPAEVECARVIPAIAALRQTFPNACLSIDTRKAAVARAALEAGAAMVNDVSGLCFDPAMKAVVAAAGCPVVLMHHQGTPETMQIHPQYTDLVGEISGFFYRQITVAQEAGIDPAQIILDPGFGFGKTPAHSLELLGRLSELVSIGFPLLVGTSRKSFLALGDPTLTPDRREALTAASIALSLQAGARFLRLHDPATQMPVVSLWRQMQEV